MYFDKNFIKQKLQSASDLVGVGHLFGPQIWIWKDLAPFSSGALVTHYEGELIKQILYCMLPKANWSGLRPPKLTLESRGPKRWTSGVLEPQPSILVKSF